MCACICGCVCTCMNVCAFVQICKCSHLLWVSGECWLPGVTELLMEVIANLSRISAFLCGVYYYYYYHYFCFSFAVFMGPLKLLVCSWFNFGRSHISRGLFISSRLKYMFSKRSLTIFWISLVFSEMSLFSFLILLIWTPLLHFGGGFIDLVYFLKEPAARFIDSLHCFCPSCPRIVPCSKASKVPQS